MKKVSWNVYRGLQHGAHPQEVSWRRRFRLINRRENVLPSGSQVLLSFLTRDILLLLSASFELVLDRGPREMVRVSLATSVDSSTSFFLSQMF